MEATTEQVSILQHTLGLTEWQREPFRNHFLAGPGHHDMPNLEALENSGLMVRRPAPKFCEPGDIVFLATEEGRALALERLPTPPKRTRYDEFLHADCFDSFGEYLCGQRLPRFESRGYRGYGRSNTMEYRMVRKDWDGVYGHHNDVEGQWAKTKKEAKASYKAALMERRQLQRTTQAAN